VILGDHGRVHAVVAGVLAEDLPLDFSKLTSAQLANITAQADRLLQTPEERHADLLHERGRANSPEAIALRARG
jgi:hypothetical protein